MKPTLLLPLFLTACSTVTMMDGSDGPLSDSTCNVRVFQTQAQAIKQGPIEEVCIITGDTVPSFNHHSSVAIERHKSKACACGANNVYVQSRTDGDFNMKGQATMVAFRFTNETPPTYRNNAPAPASNSANQPSPVTSKTGDANSETAKVIQLLTDQGIPYVGDPTRFKQKGNLSYYEARGPKGNTTQVVCESGGACRLRTIHD